MRTGGEPTRPGPQPEVATGVVAVAARTLEQHRDHVLRSLRRQGISATDAEDLAQEVFLIMARRWRSYDPARSLRAWLVGIVVRVAHRHRQVGARLVPQPDLDVPDLSLDLDEQLDGARRWALLWRAIDRLPEAQRELLVLHHLEDLPVQEIAALQGVPLFTAYTRLRAARLQLVRQVQALGSARARALLPLVHWLTGPRPGVHQPSGAPGEARPGAPLAGGGPPRPRLALSVLAVGVLALGLLAPAWSWLLPVGASHAAAPDAGSNAATLPAPAGPRRPTGSITPRRPPSFVQPPPWDVPVQAGGARLLGHWTFDDPAGSPVVRDRSSWGNHCQWRRLPGAAPAAQGAPGEPGVQHLDGHSWLECPAAGALASIDSELTIALWIKPAGTRRRQVLLTRQLGSSGNRMFSLRMQNGALEFLSHIWARLIRRPIGAPEGWLHVAAVRDRDGTRLYLNGVDLGRNLVRNGLSLAGGRAPLIIGGQVNGPERDREGQDLFEGALDDVRLYGRALGAAEIQSLSRDRAPVRQPGSGAS
jgi:RNA polymerase sigma-70 factor (ECF subfamily)